MWICPKCSRENGNSFNSCKGCGYIISESEKASAIEQTKQKIAGYNRRRPSSGHTYGHSSYKGPKVAYDEDDSYIQDIYTDDMFDDDDDGKKSHKGIVFTIIVIILLFILGAGALYYLDYQGYINLFSNTDFIYTEDTGGITITGYKGDDTTLEIPDVVDGNIVTAIGNNAFEDSNLKSVALPDTLKTIGDRAFFNSKTLHEIIIPDGVNTIGSYAFASCSSLNDTFIPESVENMGEGVVKNSGDMYIRAVPGSAAMTYALEQNVEYTATDSGGNMLTVTPVRTDDKQTLTTSKEGYGANYLFSFTPYENSKYEIAVEASIEGYLVIDDFGTMGDAETEQEIVDKNHQTSLTADLKKEKKYYFAIKNQGTEENKNIQFSLEIKTVTDEQTQAENEAKNWVGKVHSFTSYDDLFYDSHSESGESHYLEWNTYKQKVIDYYIESDGTLWVAINSPDSQDGTLWWHKVED